MWQKGWTNMCYNICTITNIVSLFEDKKVYGSNFKKINNDWKQWHKAGSRDQKQKDLLQAKTDQTKSWLNLCNGKSGWIEQDILNAEVCFSIEWNEMSLLS